MLQSTKNNREGSVVSLMQFHFESEYLQGNTTVSIILPDRPRTKPPETFYSGQKYKVLWLLHGTFGDSTDWIRKSNIELYACERDLIVVMPSALNSNYANWPQFSIGYNMFDYLIKELMPLVHGWLPASDKREDNYIAGLSMGGRGACVYAFNHPEKFAGAAILSAAPRDLAWCKKHEPGMYQRLQAAAKAVHGSLKAFGESYENTWRLADEKANDPNLPMLYFASGTEDHLYPAFVHFRKHAEAIGLKATFEEIPGYAHEWRFWDLAIQRALDFFGLTNPNAGNPY